MISLALNNWALDGDSPHSDLKADALQTEQLGHMNSFVKTSVINKWALT